MVNRRLQKVALRARIFAGFMGPMMNMVNNLGLAIVACSGGWLAVQGLATVGAIATFINYAGRLGLAAQPDRPAVQLDPVGAGRRGARLRADG